MPAKPGLLVLMLGLLVVTLGCSETKEEILNAYQDDLDGDEDLPDGFVAGERPANPPTSYTVPCPWGEVEDPANNPYLSGNLGADQIASIDAPIFVEQSRWGGLLDFENIIAVELGGIVRGFPVRILLHHEVVNLCWQTPDGPRYSYLTYCPLVDAAVHFVHDFPCNKPRRNAFGVSGFIYNGNLSVFNRGTDPPDMFVQLYAGGVFNTCTTAQPLFTSMTYSMFRRLYPEAKVLSQETGLPKPEFGYNYFDHPYWDYWRTGDIWFPLSGNDNRLGKFVPVFGVIVPGMRKAYTLRESYVLNENLAQSRVVVWCDDAYSSAAVFERVVDGMELTFEYVGRESHSLPLYRDVETGTIWTFDGIAVEGELAGRRLPRAIGIRVFWFAWSSMYPQTELYKPAEGWRAVFTSH